MRRVIALFTLGTTITVFVLVTIFIGAVEVGLEHAASGNTDVMKPIIALGVLVIIAVTLLGMVTE